MSAAAIAVTAIAVSGAEALAVAAAWTWLVYTRRIVFAATPKAPVQQQGTADGQPAAIPGGTP